MNTLKTILAWTLLFTFGGLLTLGVVIDMYDNWSKIPWGALLFILLCVGTLWAGYYLILQHVERATERDERLKDLLSRWEGSPSDQSEKSD